MPSLLNAKTDSAVLCKEAVFKSLGIHLGESLVMNTAGDCRGYKFY